MENCLSVPPYSLVTMKNQEISSDGLDLVEQWDRLQLKDSFSGYKPRLGVTAEAHQGWLKIDGTNSQQDLLCRNKRFSRHNKSPSRSVTLTALATERACEWGEENQLSNAIQGEQKSVFLQNEPPTRQWVPAPWAGGFRPRNLDPPRPGYLLR